MKVNRNLVICVTNLLTNIRRYYMFSPLYLGTNHMLGIDNYTPLTTNGRDDCPIMLN